MFKGFELTFAHIRTGQVFYPRQSVGFVCECRCQSIDECLAAAGRSASFWKQTKCELNVVFCRSWPQPDEYAKWLPEVHTENTSEIIVCAQPLENAVRKSFVLRCLNLHVLVSWRNWSAYFEELYWNLRKTRIRRMYLVPRHVRLRWPYLVRAT